MYPRLPLLLFALLTSLAGQPKPADYALILADPPVAGRVSSRSGLHTTGARAHRGSIQAKQETLRAELSRGKIQVTGSSQTLVNAIFVRVPADRVSELQDIPGVAGVVYLPPLHRHLDRALGLTQVPAAWNAIGGVENAGAGVKIAVIDTGIDQNHAAFQDSLPVPDGFPKGDAAFTNSKVIVARSYIPAPDDASPRDRVGHGTAIAMIAAGARNAGPAATITGVAPKSWLGNYKIYGSPGVNDQTSGGAMIQALEDALADGMDIAALATGDPAQFGPLARDAICSGPAIRSYIPVDACDIRAQAIENAVRMGLTVVVTAGNHGDTGFNFPALGTVDTPGTAPSAITVGATTNSHIFFSTVGIAGNGVPSNLQVINSMTGEGPKPASPLAAPLRDVAQSGDDGLACASLRGNSLAGAVALIQRGNCAFNVKVNNAQRAGAVAVLLYQLSGKDDLFVPINLRDTAIPLFFIGNKAGAALRNLLRSNSSLTATLDPALHPEDAPFDSVADFSSRGPAIGTFAIKPELLAVGTDLYTATQTFDPRGDIYDPTGYTAVSGNSFSVPLVAGAVALVKQAHPNFTPAQLKSAVVNTATGNVQDGSGGRARVTSIGAGKLNAAGAVSTGATVDPPTVAFGAIGAGSLPLTQTLNVTNTGVGPATFVFSSSGDSDNNAAMSVSPGSLPLDPGQTGTVTVRLDGSRPNPGSYEGQIFITGGGANLHVPYLYLAGDGTPQNVFAIAGDGVVGRVNETGILLLFRLTDRYGVPVTGIPVRFRAGPGGGKIESGDTATALNGVAGAFVTLGPQAGDQVFFADVGGFTQEFDLVAVVR